MPASSGDLRFYAVPFLLLMQRWPWSLHQALIFHGGDFASAEIPGGLSPLLAVNCFSGYKDSLTHTGIKCHLPCSLFHLDSWIPGKLGAFSGPCWVFCPVVSGIWQWSYCTSSWCILVIKAWWTFRLQVQVWDWTFFFKKLPLAFFGLQELSSRSDSVFRWLGKS